MNKDQFARLERHRKVKQVLTANAPAVASVPAFSRLVADYLTRLGLLDGAARRNGVTSEGATLVKTAAGSALIARLVKAANALYLLYKSEADLEEAAKMPRQPSDYTSMSALEVATVALDLSQRLTARQADLTDYNIKPADVASLTADAQSFDGILPSPQLAIDAGKIKGATAKATLSALNRFLKDDLRPGMELLKDSAPETYKALREACQVDDAGYRKKKAKRAGKNASSQALPNNIPTGE
jgi:hypothetical protein